VRIDELRLSDDLIARMAESLGNPTEDPHGAPIPTAAGEVDETRLPSIADLHDGESATVVRMSDRDPAFLRYLDELGVRPGATVQVVAKAPFEGPITVRVGAVDHVVGTTAAEQVFVRPEP
jgi:DtxR family Mn-dependent transcriptional regulator